MRNASIEAESRRRAGDLQHVIAAEHRGETGDNRIWELSETPAAPLTAGRTWFLYEPCQTEIAGLETLEVVNQRRVESNLFISLRARALSRQEKR